MWTSLVLWSSLGVGPAQALTLDEAWQAAETQSAELVVAHEQRVQSDTLKTQAWSLLGPKLSIGGNYIVNQRESTLDFSNMFPAEVLGLIETMTGEPVDFGDPLVINKKAYFDANVTVTQPIFSGQAIPLFMAAGAQVTSGRENERAARAQLKVAIARVYWGALVAREGTHIAADSLALAKKHLAMAQTMVDNGAAPPQTKLQAEIAVARAERDFEGAQARSVAATGQLARFTGAEPGAPLEAPGLRTHPFASEAEAMAYALEHRPDLAAATAQARAARLQRTSADASWFPRVDARFTESYTQNAGFSGENTAWMFALAGTWTLWDGGARLADEAKGASVVRMTAAMEDNARENVETEVATAWAERTRAQRAVASAEQEVALGMENVRLAELSFQNGALSFLDTEDARMGLDASKLTLLSERMNLDLATLTLLQASGALDPAR